MKMNSKQRVAFIAQSILLLCAIGFLLYCLVGVVSIGKYPSANSLVYEECTFVRCEQKNTTKSSRYYIYVEEYEKPMVIDNIVISQINREELLSLEVGDKITVSKYDGKKEYTLYSLSHGETGILLYEDYLLRHNKNNATGMVISSAFFSVVVSIFIWSVYYYKKTGKCLHT